MKKCVVNFVILIFISSMLNACSDSNSGSGKSTNQDINYGDETFFPFDEESGAVAYNSKFDKYNGLIVGASRTAGKVNNALYFGNNLPSYVSFSEGTEDEAELIVDFPDGTISIEAWVNFESLNPNEEYHLFGSARSGVRNFTLDVIDGQLNFVLYTPDDAIDLIETDYVFGVDTWYHIAFTYSGSEAKFYIDGELNTTSSIAAPVNKIYNPLYLGGARRSSSLSSFPGFIAVLRFSSALRSANEIQEYYESTR